MKKLIFLIVAAVFSIATYAQDKSDEKLVKPKDIKVHEFDDFKNSSFNIYEKSVHYKKMADGEEGLNAKDITEAKKLSEDVLTLSKKADGLMDKAKNIKPKTKSPAAIKNTTKSVEALNKAKENLSYILDKSKD